MVADSRISLADLAGGAAEESIVDDDGRPVRPALVVDLGTASDPGVLERARRAAERAGRILIGVGAATPAAEATGLLRALDLTLVPGTSENPCCVGVAEPDTAADELLSSVGSRPRAALTLAGLLRAGGDLLVPAALEVESLAYSALLGGPEFRQWLAGHRPAPPPDVADPVLVERSAGQLTITLNRPERRNAYGAAMRDALVDALRIAELDRDIDRVVLTGAGPSFCAGGDLGEFGTAPDPVTAHLIRTRAGAALPLHRIAGLVEARVHGSCVGAGVELAAFAGHVVSTSDATFRLPELAMGLVPGAGGTVSLPRRVGRWRTCYLAITGRELRAPTAHAWGLIDALR